MSENTDTIRYYIGDAMDLDGLTRDQVIEVTDEYYWECEDRYEETLSEVYGEMKLGPFTWDAGRVIREMDPIAFGCGVSEEICEVDLNDYPLGGERHAHSYRVVG